MSPRKKAPVKKAAAKPSKAAPKAAKGKGKAEVPKKPRKKTPRSLRGMKDLLPKDESYWRRMYKKADEISAAYEYQYIETPIVEEAALFVRSIGKGTDVVDKEMYVFEDRDGGKIALRPEATASIARAYIEHGLHSTPQPSKVWYCGPMFRYDRPQAGRYREFHQFGAESIGERSPVVDAEVIALGYNFIRDLGIETTVYINSIGTVEDRERYLIELVGYFRSKRSYLSDLSKKRLTKNPLRILDSKEEQDIPIVEEAPQILDWLSEKSRTYFMQVLEYLDEAGVPYALKPTLVRGLDYYTDTVFEFYVEEGETGSQSALGGGGRYDGLIEELGGQPTPAAGFALGLERIMRILRAKDDGRELVGGNDSKIFFAQLGEQSRRRALGMIEGLRREGIVVQHNLAKTSLKAQLELANKYGVTHAVILGQKELLDGAVIIRDMESGIQEIVDQKKLGKELEKILKKGK
ncbi:MAG: histidine--tRNA ligase [Candidatus Magasanikbacteria bacterium]|nr:histidine--tRNA ligase [Candidatus Magasanikbacteria bacterium]MBT4220951.1 histidine--tRNA ligase [Candidatus Magasanikbacteria bacterium]MBT6253357.1 histidine--tRNA ligase [Candidatus Magasanikbacteria bacterium]MBT6334961.1 histidine--tRNA ligase [Candidatus Magasanikbacteria bacterium]